MNTETLLISRDSWLDTVLAEIPTNTILNKTICGIGATTLEIESNRHSIIIEPNVPVIVGKAKKHPTVLGIIEGVTVENIKDYIENCKEYVKIITTPESFGKVRKALNSLGVKYRKDYFMLFDECEKIVQDIDYRNTISLPIDEFFKFENKAMVSATPIIPSDPRFEEQGFSILKIKPDYDYKRDLDLTPTNNVYCTFRKILDEIGEENTHPICIFFNSIDGIDELITLLNIKELSNIYCGTESVSKLKEIGYENVTDSLYNENEEISLKRYNFFTSRYYSAVDIEIKEKPILILLTDVFIAPYSKIDPYTCAIQIAGRFRNGITRYIHITNYNKDAKFKGRKAIESFLNGGYTIYSEFLNRRLHSRNLGEIHILKEFLETTSHRIYVTPSGKRNYFMYHNAYMDDELEGIYKYPAPIRSAYEKTGAFNIFSQNRYSRYTDNDRRILNSKNKSKAELNKLVFYQISKLLKYKNKDIYDVQYLKDLRSRYRLVFDAMMVLGEQRIIELGFKETALKTEIAKLQNENQYMNPKIFKTVHSKFKENTWYGTSNINNILTSIFINNDIKPDNRGVARMISFYFIATKNRKSRSDGWMLGKRKYFKR